MKISKLDDLKDFKGDVSVDANKLYEIIKNNVAPATYDSFMKLFQTEEFQKIIKQYDLVKGDTYGKALYNLIQNATSEQPQFTLEDGSKIYRPNTFKENLIARIDNPEFFKNWLDSCTGIAYKKGTNLVKINPETKELITLDKDFNKSYLIVDYKNFDGEEIDVTKASDKDKWLVAMGGINQENKEVYDEHKAKLIQFKEDYLGRKLSGNEKDNLMGFYTRDKPSENQLRAVFVYDGGNDNSVAIGSDDLVNDAQFLQVNASETHK